MRFTAPHSSNPVTQAGIDYATILYRNSGPSPENSQSLAEISAVPTSQIAFWRDEWIQAGRRKGQAETTNIQRLGYVEKLLWFLNKEKCERCGIDELNAFIDYCRDGHTDPHGRWESGLLPNVGARAYQPMADATVLSYYLYISSLFTFMVNRGVIEVSPFVKVDKPKGNDDQIEPFSKEQIHALLYAADRSPVPARNRAIVLFLLDTGVRVSEMCHLKIRDVDFSSEKALGFRVLGKGNKKRTVRLSSKATDSLWKYFQDEHNIRRRRHNGPGRGVRSQADGDTPVFMSVHKAHFGEALSRSGVYQMISALGEAARIGGVRCSPHTFRHTFGITFLRAGGDIFTLQAMFGHKDLKTVQIYLKIAQADTQEQHRRFSPVESMMS